jgi:type I restriction enzyme S subunit
LASRVSAYQLYLAANGVTRFGLTYQGTKNLRIALPSVPEQQQIAAFLDWKTGQIDALIARKQELLEKLKEKRLAVITQAVTRGLNPAAPLRDSGIPWLGQVPQHWEVKRLRFLVEAIDQGWSPRASNVAAEGDELGVLKLSAVSCGRFVPEENKMLEEVPENQAIQTPRKHDLLITRANTPELVGDACAVQQDYPRLIIPDLIYRLTMNLSQSEEVFVSYFLLSKQGRAQIESDARGSSGSMVKLGQGHLKNFQIPSPPVEEQKAISTYLEKQTGRIDGLMEKVNQAIDRLTEYRTALITAATTGKIDVRNAKIPEPVA